MSDLDDDELFRYTGDRPSYVAPVAKAEQKPKKKVRMFLEGDDEEEEDEKPRVRKRASVSGGAEAPPEKEGPNEAFANFTKHLATQGKYMTLAATFKPFSSRQIDTRAKLACETLVRDAEAIRLPNDTKEELQLLLQCTDEGTVVNPLITLFKTVETGTCLIYMKETVPLSVYLMALVLKATFFVQVTEKLKTPKATFDTVAVKPFKGGKNSDKQLAQPFGIEKAVEEQLEGQEDKLEQVEAYMHVIGPLSSAEACDGNFIEEQVEQVKKIFSGEFQVVKQRERGERGGAVPPPPRGGGTALSARASAFLEGEEDD